MIRMEIKDFDLCQIADSGQCFRWRKLNQKHFQSCELKAASVVYSIIAFGKYLEVAQTDSVFQFDCTEKEFQEIWYHYFDFDTDYKTIKSIAEQTDQYLQAAICYGRGIRILKQELWEVLISFIISQNNNITRIKNSIEELCIRYGQINEGKNGSYHVFPTAECLSKITLTEFRQIGMGYRDQYLLAAANWWIGLSEKEESFVKYGYSQTAERLQEIKGVGKKVADCICLYGLHFLNSFPIDTHIKKILENHYPNGFPFDKYKENLGIFQQYMFYYDLSAGKHSPASDV